MRPEINLEANLISRMERMPFNKTLLGVISLLTWVWVVEAFDVGLIGQVVVVLKKIWTLDASSLGLLGSCSTIGVVIGTSTAGFFTDKYGRRRVLLCGTFIFTFFTLIGSVYADLNWIIAMRFLSGLGAGAVFPLPYLMISEIAPARHRGMIVCFCNAILTCAFMLPTVCGSWAIKTFPLEEAWRVPFFVGGIPLFTLYFLYKWLPESPRWLMKNGRHQEVKAFVEKMEKSAGKEHDDDFVNPAVLNSLQQAAINQEKRGKSWKLLFKPPLLSRSLVSWGMYVAGLITWYVIMVYVPTILTNYGFDMSNSVILTGAMMVLGGLGSVVIGPLADRYGRKITWSVYVFITAVSLFMLTATESISWLLFIGGMVAFFGSGVLPVCKVYIAEQYPTELRGVGTGFGETVGRVCGGVLATYYLAFFISVGGVSAVFTFMGVAFTIAMLSLWIWGRETARLSVEDSSGTS